MRVGRLFLSAIAGCAIVGCVPNPDGSPIPIFAPSGSGSSSAPTTRPPWASKPAPAEPIVPPVYTADSGTPSAEYEQHGAVSVNDCYAMEKRFRNEGRDVTLADVVSNHLNGGGGVLEFLCLFEGPDAKIETAVFDDNRYNRPDETAYP